MENNNIEKESPCDNKVKFVFLPSENEYKMITRDRDYISRDKYFTVTLPEELENLQVIDIPLDISIHVWNTDRTPTILFKRVKDNIIGARVTIQAVPEKLDENIELKTLLNAYEILLKRMEIYCTKEDFDTDDPYLKYLFKVEVDKVSDILDLISDISESFESSIADCVEYCCQKYSFSNDFNYTLLDILNSSQLDQQ